MSKRNALSRNVWSILGLPFDLVNLAEAVVVTQSAVDNAQRCFLTTPNLNFLIAAQSDQAFFQSVVDSDLSIADGMPIVWVAKLLGIPIAERVAGSDLFAHLSKLQGREKKISVFFFGGQAGIAERASQAINANSVAMSCCGFYDPGFVSVDKMSSPEIIELINQANPDFLVVALGAGKGQSWIQKKRLALNAPVISHLGAVINFVAGHVERAPVFWQRLGVEWLWRIKQEPDLWQRYFFDGLAFLKLLLCKVLPLAVYDGYLKRTSDFNEPASIAYDAGAQVIHLMGSVKFAELQAIKAFLKAVLEGENGDVVLACGQLTYIDGAFIGSLLLFQRHLNEQDRQLYLLGLTKRVSYLMNLNNVLNRFQLKADCI
ncbi:hypothetical protein AU255_03870 [Methyloprofundus sedimenti]|uniref:STAS domain-containing protein n=1 Tax=Methyloprofundus sedimenti TaxID=1420851 RepID=A0A1V8M660_9GAMM|nr:WecB/TagA/CpsF family glycosyltransferase [Methyloprofundus sedimenti]OQK17045.1 hypothetical protein AU255_03870 [Methyloprofundus sedimenti]